jgi:hypothetical protein
MKSDMSTDDLAGLLYDLLQHYYALYQIINIYPAHGAGSACGKI